MRTSLVVLFLSTAVVLGGCSTTQKAAPSCTVTENADGTSTLSCPDGTSTTLRNGPKGGSCTVADTGDGTKVITCEDGTHVTVQDGRDGANGDAGTGCTVVDNQNGTYTVACGGNSVVVKDGQPGDAGVGCSVTDNGDSTYTVECGGASVVVHDGQTGAGCSVTQNSSGASTITCGGSSVVVNDGTGCEVEDWSNGLTQFTCANSQVTTGNLAFYSSQSITAAAPRTTHSFTIGTDTFLVVPDYYSTTVADSALSAKVLKWNAAANRFDPFQTLNTGARVTSVTDFDIAGVKYLLLGAYYDGDYATSSPLYRWDGTTFVLAQSLSTSGAIDVAAFTLGGTPYIAIANFVTPSVSYASTVAIYSWDGTAFVAHSNLPVNGPFDLEFFQSGTHSFLAVTSNYTGGTYTSNSYVYEWNGTSFGIVSTLVTSGALKAKMFEINSTPYLAIASYYNGSSYATTSTVYRWNGTTFVVAQTFSTLGPESVDVITTLDGSTLLAFGSFRDGSAQPATSLPVYKWDNAASSFTNVATVQVRAAQNVRFFQTGTQTYFVAAASEAAAGTTTTSPVLKWTGEALVPSSTVDSEFPFNVDAFRIGNRAFLAFANSYSNVSASYATNVRVVH